ACAVVWLLQQREADSQRGMVVRDVQWAEKTIRLHKQSAENFLLQLAGDLASGELDGEVFDQRVTRHIAVHGQLVEVAWVGEDGRDRWAAPAPTAYLRASRPLEFEQMVPFKRAEDLVVISYGEPRQSVQGSTILQVHVPVRSCESFVGTIVGVFSAERMVAELVPDWFAER